MEFQANGDFETFNIIDYTLLLQNKVGIHMYILRYFDIQY